MERRHFIKVASLAAISAVGLPVCVSAAESQGGWRWCKKCEGLWFADGGEARKGKCPAGESHHHRWMSPATDFRLVLSA